MIDDLARGFGTLLRLMFLAALLIGCAAGEGDTKAPAAAPSTSLAGQFLVATPQMSDPRFAETVILVISHDRQGAMGVIVNRAYGSGPLRSLLDGFGITVGANDTQRRGGTRGDTSAVDMRVRLYEGGPVQPDHGLILHSTDYAADGTRFVGTGVALSAGPDVLRALAAGQGPRRQLILLGYAGWGPGQLENELARNDWFTAPAPTSEVFSDHPDTLWQDVLRTAGTPL